MFLHIGDKKIGLNDIIPEKLRPVGVEFKLGYSGFYVKTKESEELESNPLVLSANDNIIVIFKGAFEYPPNAVNFRMIGEKGSISVKKIMSRDDLILLYFKVSNKDIKDEELELVANSVPVIISLRMGTNAILEKFVSDTTIITYTDEQKYSRSGKATIRFLSYELSGARLDETIVNESLELIDVSESNKNVNRIVLSTNWFLKSLSQNSVDSFLSKWIAFESLLLEDSTNISPIKKIVSDAYENEFDKLSDIIPIGRVYNLRGMIVHSGTIVDLSIEFKTFINLLYEDCLNEVLGLERKKRCLAYLEDSKFNVSEYLRELT